jgi:predicted Zn-ribbon and HTH transcriptional regulator
VGTRFHCGSEIRRPLAVGNSLDLLSGTIEPSPVSRRNLIPLLSGNPRTIRQLAQQLRVTPADLEADLDHLAKSLVHGEWRIAVTPAVCRKCGFEFGADKLRKPSRCPACRATWLTEPKVEIVPRQ